MASTYSQIVSEELHLIKELNNLDCILVKDENEKNNYPHLFHDQESSLFQPDQCYGNQKARQEEIFQYQPPKKNFRKIQNNKDKDVQMFEQYLDSLDINQFLQRQCGKSFRSKEKDKNSLECTFKPSILKKSSSIAGNLKPSFDRLTSAVSAKKLKAPYKPLDKSQNKKLYSKERIERLSKPRPLKTEPAEEKVQYTFKPNLDKKSLEQMSSCYLDVATRNKLWLEQKEAKVQKLREEEEEKKVIMKENKYIPKIKNYKGEKEANLSKFIKDGMVNYFERVSVAKQRNSYVQKATQLRESNISGYSSKKIEKSPLKERNNKTMKENNDTGNRTNKKTTTSSKRNSNNNGQKKKYKDAVQELHEKIMKLKI